MAATPAVVVNWAGDDVVSCEEWLDDLGQLSGHQPGDRLRGQRITNSAADKTGRMR